MSGPTALIVAGALTLAAQSVPAGPPRTAEPVTRGFTRDDFPRLVKVTDNVYTYEDLHSGAEAFTTTNMIVETSEGVLVADAQGSALQTKGLVDAVARMTRIPIRHVVIGSDHGDHTAGNAALPGNVTYYVHPASKAVLDRQAAGSRPGAWALPADARTVSDRLAFMLGGEPIEILFLGRAHTGGDLAVWLPRQRVLYLGEIFLNRVFPAMRSAYPSEWLATVDKALSMNADVYIPGHGFTESGPVSREELVAFRGALAAVIAEATRLYNAGVPVDEAVKQARWGDYANWTLAASQGPIAVRKIYEELSAK
jgi:glyoxylase-like metal-dependent hydrolase (beta-lactamase superfamily II)